MDHHEIPGAEMYKGFCVVAGLGLFVTLLLHAQTDPSSASGALAAMRDKFRPLLVFYPRSSSAGTVEASLREQQRLLTGHEKELKDRDVELMFVPSPTAESKAAGLDTGLRTRFHIDGRFTVVLLGKDGGEKFRSHVPVTIEKLNALIDAMPMRQQEIRDGHTE